MSEEDYLASLLDHFNALRSTLVQCLCIILTGCFFCFIFTQPILEWFTAPLNAKPPLTTEQSLTTRITNHQTTPQLFHLPTKAVVHKELPLQAEEITPDTFLIPPEKSLTYTRYELHKQPLVILGPLEGMKIALKTAFLVGFVLTAPLWGFCLAKFIAPALRREEKRAAIPFLLTSAGFIVMGGAFAYYVTIPLANAYLAQFNSLIGVNLWSLSHYLDYSLFLLIANAAAFQLAVFGLFAVHYRLVTAETLSSHRRGAIVAAFILGALLTPPDVATQILMAIPLIALYESVVLYARLRKV